MVTAYADSLTNFHTLWEVSKHYDEQRQGKIGFYRSKEVMQADWQAQVGITCNISTRRIIRSACFRHVRKPWMHKTWIHEKTWECAMHRHLV